MPNKSAFYFFMVEFRNDHKKRGIHYRSLKEVAEICGPLWKALSHSEKQWYYQMRKKNSLGQFLHEVEAEEKKEMALQIKENLDLKTLIWTLSSNKTILDADFFIIDINELCEPLRRPILIGEVSIVRFSIRDGVKNFFHEIIHPGTIPIGYHSEVKNNCKEYGLNFPDQNENGTNLILVLEHILDSLALSMESNEVKIPNLYGNKDKIRVIKKFLESLCNIFGMKNPFRVYRLDQLLYTLVQSIKMPFDNGYPAEIWATQVIDYHCLFFTVAGGCEHHNAIDKIPVCTTARVREMAFAVCDACCPLVGIKPEPGKHLPKAEPHVIQRYIERSIDRAGIDLSQHNRGDPNLFQCMNQSDSSEEAPNFSDSSDSLEQAEDERRDYAGI